MCYHAEIGRSALKGVGINIGEPQNWGALELGMRVVADPKIQTHPPHMLPCGTWVFYVKWCSQENHKNWEW